MNTLRLQLRFLLPLLLTLVAAAYLALPLMDRLTLRWFSRDLNLRGELVANTLSDSVAAALPDPNGARLQALFNRAVQDERLVAIGLCSGDDKLLRRTDGFPKDLTCRRAAEIAAEPNPLLRIESGSVHVGVHRVNGDAGPIADLILLHDLSFIERRSQDTRYYLIVLIAALGVVIALITVVVAQLSWRGWISGARALLRGGRAGPPARRVATRISAVRCRLARALARPGRRVPPFARPADRMEPGAPALTVAHPIARRRGDRRLQPRAVYPERTPNGVIVRRPASGLVTAVELVMRACSGTWIAHGGGSADQQVVDTSDRVRVPPGVNAYTLRRLWLTAEEEQGYYYGFANEGLWPLCHVAHVRPVFRESDWQHYRAVNQRFADAVVAGARSEDPVVLVQDYHFALLPAMIREQLPRATILTFWHIPWPNPESFGICPWRREIVQGMLGSTILGFRTPFHCKNFIETVDRYLEARIEHEHSTISYREEETLIASYPISIEWPTAAAVAAWPTVAQCRRNVFERLELAPEQRLAIGVDRFDYTKGILERLNAVERLLEKYPQWIGRFVFVQVAAPSRSSLEEYRSFQERIGRQTERINQRFGRDGYTPVHLLAEHHEHDAD